MGGEDNGPWRCAARASTVVFGEVLVELRAVDPPRTGVFAPEELFTLEQLGPAFERSGFEIADR
jgi:hypothetical protein